MLEASEVQPVHKISALTHCGEEIIIIAKRITGISYVLRVILSTTRKL